MFQGGSSPRLGTAVRDNLHLEWENSSLTLGLHCPLDVSFSSRTRQGLIISSNVVGFVLVCDKLRLQSWGSMWIVLTVLTVLTALIVLPMLTVLTVLPVLPVLTDIRYVGTLSPGTVVGDCVVHDACPPPLES
jgi:hypothetical protein